jgi:hypothetical protein
VLTLIAHRCLSIFFFCRAFFSFVVTGLIHRDHEGQPVVLTLIVTQFREATGVGAAAAQGKY